MTASIPQDFTAKLVELEPFLSVEARRSLLALRGLMECFPGQTMPEIEKNVRALKAILACFPGQSAAEAEKSIRSLLQASRTSVPVMTERAKALVGGTAGESSESFLKDLKKLDTGDLACIGKNLGFTLSGTKTKMAEDLRIWLESRGQSVPVSAKEQSIAEGRRLAAPVRGLMQNVTPENANRILQAVEMASKDLKPDGFQAFAAELGITANGSKAVMRKQVKDFVSKLSVSHVQTQF